MDDGSLRAYDRIDRAEIEQIKNHVFEDLHPLEGVDGGTVMARFDPTPTWRRRG